MAVPELHLDPDKGDSVETGAIKGATLLSAKMANKAAALYADTRGALMVEYSVLIGAIAITGSMGLVAIGLALVRSFDFVRGLLLCPIP